MMMTKWFNRIGECTGRAEYEEGSIAKALMGGLQAYLIAQL